MDIGAEAVTTGDRIDQNRFESPLEKVTGVAMPAIEPHAVAQIEPADRFAEIAFGQFDEDVIIDNDYPSKRTRASAGQNVLVTPPAIPEMGAISVIAKDGPAFDPAGGDVIPDSQPNNPQ